MREVKFRAWFEGEMLSHENLVYKDQETHAMYTIITNEEREDGVYYMQYTGLKDKNGVEIYEGDCFVKIVSYINFEEQTTFTQKEVCVVKFHEGKFTVYQDGWGHFDLIDVINQRTAGADSWESGIVVGNIYENPELLKVSK